MPLLVTSQATQAVAAYQMDSKGQLTAAGVPLTTGAGAIPNAAVIVGSAAFVANGGSNDIARFSVNADATLTPAVGGNQPTGVNPLAFAVDHTGKFLFVANQGDQTISAFKISGTNLFPAGTVASAADPIALAVSPTNNYLYAANSLNGTISGYTFDASSGALSPMIQPPVSSIGSAPSALAVTPDGKYLFAANSGSNDVAGFTICTAVNSICPSANGSLAPYLHAPYLAGVSPRSVAISQVSTNTGACDPVGCSYYLFVVDEFSNQVSLFTAVPTIDNLTGLTTDQLRANNPAVVGTGTNPVSIAIPSTGGFAFIANSGSASVSSFTIRPDGTLLSNGGAVATGAQPSSLAPR
jgi:6-phosphogluconolactonase (cycloisomerase 2 family)